MSTFPFEQEEKFLSPRVVVIGLASCYGCQLQITNNESYLLEVLGQIDLQYWQLVSSGDMPKNFDVAIIEGAVTTKESYETVRRLRDEATTVISIGACAHTAGIPGLAAKQFEERIPVVYEELPSACGNLMSPRAVSDVIDVDYCVPCCPIDPQEFLEVLDRALYGSNRMVATKTMCGDCKRNESGCFYETGRLCLGLVTQAGCSARCVNLGRPCNGCRGLSPDANIDSAREAVVRYGVSPETFNAALELFNQINPILLEKE